MIVIAFAILIITPLITWSTNYSSENTRTLQASIALNKITETANELYSAGPGSRTTVRVYFPTGIENTYVLNKTVGILLPISSGTTDIYAETKGDIQGEIPKASGLQAIKISVDEEGYIIIGY